MLDDQQDGSTTPQDTPEHTSPKGLGIVGEVMAELIYRGG